MSSARTDSQTTDSFAMESRGHENPHWSYSQEKTLVIISVGSVYLHLVVAIVSEIVLLILQFFIWIIHHVFKKVSQVPITSNIKLSLFQKIHNRVTDYLMGQHHSWILQYLCLHTWCCNQEATVKINRPYTNLLLCSLQPFAEGV